MGPFDNLPKSVRVIHRALRSVVYVLYASIFTFWAEPHRAKHGGDGREI
jgi:hypothetical protein